MIFDQVSAVTSPIVTAVVLKKARRLLLDIYGGAKAAYSLRAISEAWRDQDVVEVRRASDDTTRGFTADDIGDGTLTNWVGTGATDHGYVATWYDQSGNGNDAVQTISTQQPKIVDAGTLVTDSNGKCSIEFDGVDDFLTPTITGITGFTNLSTFNVIEPAAAAAADTNTMVAWSLGNWNAVRSMALASSTVLTFGEKFTSIFDDSISKRLGSSTYSRAATTPSVFSSFHLSTGTSIFSQGAAVTLDRPAGMTTSTPASPSDTGYTTDDIVRLGCVRGNIDGSFVQEKFSEVIFYNSDQSSNRTGIEGNINDYYEIFADETYRRPDGSAIFRPDGTSVYERP
jgi:hypothetical protein